MSRIVWETDGTAQIERYLGDAIYAFNVAKTGINDGASLTAVVRETSGTIIAGINGHTWGGCWEIKQLWVRETDRRRGLGRRLMATAETEAKRRGCTQTILSTHSFQAPAFYESLGFEKVASVPDYPRGHQDCRYRKRLV
jgi:ribosomal protein S18 acetylase RimI-like enzyme